MSEWCDAEWSIPAFAKATCDVPENAIAGAKVLNETGAYFRTLYNYFIVTGVAVSAVARGYVRDYVSWLEPDWFSPFVDKASNFIDCLFDDIYHAIHYDTPMHVVFWTSVISTIILAFVLCVRFYYLYCDLRHGTGFLRFIVVPINAFVSFAVLVWCYGIFSVILAWIGIAVDVTLRVLIPVTPGGWYTVCAVFLLFGALVCGLVMGVMWYDSLPRRTKQTTERDMKTGQTLSNVTVVEMGSLPGHAIKSIVDLVFGAVSWLRMYNRGLSLPESERRSSRKPGVGVPPPPGLYDTPAHKSTVDFLKQFHPATLVKESAGGPEKARPVVCTNFIVSPPVLKAGIYEASVLFTVEPDESAMEAEFDEDGSLIALGPPPAYEKFPEVDIGVPWSVFTGEAAATTFAAGADQALMRVIDIDLDDPPTPADLARVEWAAKRHCETAWRSGPYVCTAVHGLAASPKDLKVGETLPLKALWWRGMVGPVHIVRLDRDIAVLSLPEHFNGCPSIRVSVPPKEIPEKEIAVHGYGVGDVRPGFTTGTVNDRRHTAGTRRGWSGGPVTLVSGRAVGIHCGVFMGGVIKEWQPFSRELVALLQMKENNFISDPELPEADYLEGRVPSETPKGGRGYVRGGKGEHRRDVGWSKTQALYQRLATDPRARHVVVNGRHFIDVEELRDDMDFDNDRWADAGEIGSWADYMDERMDFHSRPEWESAKRPVPSPTPGSPRAQASQQAPKKRQRKRKAKPDGLGVQAPKPVHSSPKPAQPQSTGRGPSSPKPNAPLSQMECQNARDGRQCENLARGFCVYKHSVPFRNGPQTGSSGDRKAPQ